MTPETQDDFTLAVGIVLEREGPMSNDPVNDPNGGLTKYGWSQTQNPDIDVASLTRDSAIELYRQRHWLTNLCDQLSWPANLFVFDASVNQGTHEARRALQQGLTSVGTYNGKIDGELGPMTQKAIDKSESWELAVNIASHRVMSYIGDSEWAMDGLGWMNRLFRNAFDAAKKKAA